MQTLAAVASSAEPEPTPWQQVQRTQALLCAAVRAGVLPPSAESTGLLSLEQLGGELYTAFKIRHDGSWLRDLDLAERLGAAWADGLHVLVAGPSGVLVDERLMG